MQHWISDVMKVVILAVMLCLSEPFVWIIVSLAFFACLALPNRAHLLTCMRDGHLHTGAILRVALLFLPLSVGARTFIVSLCVSTQHWITSLKWMFCRAPNTTDFKQFYTILSRRIRFLSSPRALAWYLKHPEGPEVTVNLEYALSEVQRQNPYITNVTHGKRLTPEEVSALAQSRHVHAVTLQCCLPQQILDIFYLCPPITSAHLGLYYAQPENIITWVDPIDISVEELLNLHVATCYVPSVTFDVSCHRKRLDSFRLRSFQQVQEQWDRCHLCLAMTGTNQYI